jgi:hypothetical protein
MFNTFPSLQRSYSFLTAQQFYAPVVLFLLHLASYTFWQGKLGAYLSPLIPLLTGAFFFHIIRRSRAQRVDSLPYVFRFQSPLLWMGLAIAILFGVQLVVLFQIMAKYPIDGFKSDVIPIIQISVRRFLSNEVVYQPITDFGRVQPVTYLPLTWLPYIPADWLNIDFRLWAFLLFSFTLGLIQYKLIRSTSHQLTQLIIALLPGLTVLIWMLNQDQDFGYTCETLIAAYYLLLVYSLIYDKKGLLLSLSILLCLLSRYSVVLFLPAMLMYCYRKFGFQRTVTCSVLILAGVMLIYILPFWLKDPSIFSQAYHYYTDATLIEWQTQPWQNPGDRPFHLYRGSGLAAYFHSLESLSLSARLSVLKNTHVIISLIVTTLSVYALIKTSIHQLTHILMLGLYGYFLLFYSLIQIPYSYLYLVLIFIEWMVVCWLLLERNATNIPVSPESDS